MVMIANRRRSMMRKRSTPGRIRGIRVIDEQARQIEQTGEPGHHRHDVKGLEPEQAALPRRKAGS